jgi:pilus assembly protein CpaB
LLRRTQTIATKIDSQIEDAPEVDIATPIADRRIGDRRRGGDRRGMEALRAEALQSVLSKVEDKNFGGLRNRVQWRPNIAPSRIALLAVALVAGGIAAFLATQHEPIAAPAPVIEAKAPTTQILVAKQEIGVGQRLSPGALEWQDWPEGALRAEYITVAAAPGALTDMAGSVARGEFFVGEPIRAEKLAPAGGGYLSALLDKGMRGVSVTVAAESASGGFVVPNDRVDVVLTRSSDTGRQSETILDNVRVLAINARLGANGTSAPTENGDPSAEVFSDQAIATLELSAPQAEAIINATTIGKLSLMLRATADATATDAVEQRTANAAIRVSSPFWTK